MSLSLSRIQTKSQIRHKYVESANTNRSIRDGPDVVGTLNTGRNRLSSSLFLFFILYAGVFCLQCLSVHYLHAMPSKSSGATDCEPPCGLWGLKPGPAEEQPVF